jgi:hypothetical protein
MTVVTVKRSPQKKFNLHSNQTTQKTRRLIPILVKIYFFVDFTFSGKKGSNEPNLTHNPI